MRPELIFGAVMGIEIDVTSISTGMAPVLIFVCLGITLLLLVTTLVFAKKEKRSKEQECCRLNILEGKENFRMSRMVAEYAAALSACGGTNAQTSSCVAYLCAHFGISAEVTEFPQHILLSSVDYKNEETFSICEKIKENPLDFDRIIKLSRLAKRVVSEKMTAEVFYEEFQKVLKCKRMNPNLVLVLASLANASFCRLFEGDAIAMGIVIVATACGFFLRRTLCGTFGMDFRLGTILAAICSTIIGTSGYAFQLGGTPNVALATSVLYLVPGIPFINSFSNLLNGMFLGCISQFFKGTILTVCLSLGFCIGLVVTNLHFF